MRSDSVAFTKALEKRAAACELLHRHKILRKAENLPAQVKMEQLIAETVEPGLYEHWKSGQNDHKFYIVEGAGLEQDVYTPLVGYRALYGPRVGRITFRHLVDEERGFLMPIERPKGPPFAYVGPRFTFVRALRPSQIATILAHAGELVCAKSRVDFFGQLSQLLAIRLSEFPLLS